MVTANPGMLARKNRELPDVVGERRQPLCNRGDPPKAKIRGDQ